MFKYLTTSLIGSNPLGKTLPSFSNSSLSFLFNLEVLVIPKPDNFCKSSLVHQTLDII